MGHCIKGTPGWEICGRPGELSEDPRCRIIDKPTFGCAELMEVLRGYDEIEICGVATNICVIANAVIARTANPEARVVVRRDCVASYDRELGVYVALRMEEDAPLTADQVEALAQSLTLAAAA